MDHGLELISPILEILEIGIILYNPGNIGKRFFLTFPILEISETEISNIVENPGNITQSPNPIPNSTHLPSGRVIPDNAA